MLSPDRTAFGIPLIGSWAVFRKEIVLMHDGKGHSSCFMIAMNETENYFLT